MQRVEHLAGRSRHRLVGPIRENAGKLLAQPENREPVPVDRRAKQTVRIIELRVDDGRYGLVIDRHLSAKLSEAPQRWIFGCIDRPAPSGSPPKYQLKRHASSSPATRRGIPLRRTLRS